MLTQPVPDSTLNKVGGCHGPAESPEPARENLSGCHGQAESPELARAINSGPSSTQKLTSPRNDLILRAARGEKTERTPVWLMRQAGRFDPEYQRLRKECSLELEDLFRDPVLAAEITMLPVRLGVDAAILFQDILTPLTPMGTHFVFRPGPVLDQPIRTARQIDSLIDFDPARELGFVAESIKLALEKLDGSIPLLGFAGSPLTLASFMIEGKSPGNAANVKTLMRDDPELCHRLLARLADMTAAYLQMQIDAGVHAVQLFESVGDLFNERQYKQFAHMYHARVFGQLQDCCPRMLFVKESPRLDLMARTGASVISVGKCIDLAEAKKSLPPSIALQGNVDNQILLKGTPDEVAEAVRECIEKGQSQGHILNLNHGILKDTPFENVCRFIDAAHTIRAADCSPAD